MKKLLFIRHGLSELNLLNLFAGSTDTALSDLGREEALLAGQRFKDSYPDINIDKIYSSPLSRAKDTAKLFAEGAGIDDNIIETESLLVERDFGSLEQTRYSKEISHGLLNDNLPEGVEKWDDVVARARQVIQKVEAQDGVILLAAHGSIGRAIKKVITENPKYQGQFDWREHIPNTTIIELV